MGLLKISNYVICVKSDTCIIEACVDKLYGEHLWLENVSSAGNMSQWYSACLVCERP